MDVPLLENYPWVHVPNRSLWPGLGHAWGLINPGLWKLVTRNNHDALILLTGYRYVSFWIALSAAKLQGMPVLFGTDASELTARDGQRWKMFVKQWFWPMLFRLADTVIVPSSRGVKLMESLGIPTSRIFLTPYVVDNDWWTNHAAQVDRTAVRRAWGIPSNVPVVLFCAKLQPWKRPRDLLRSFAAAAVPDAYLVFAGEGPLRSELEAEAHALGLSDRVRFLGFTNQTLLPSVYCASDLMVLPSEYEPFGLVVNEAMLCGCPAIVSDRVGAHEDLIAPGQNGFVFRSGDVESLTTILRNNLVALDKLREFDEAARRRMQSWSPAENINGLINAVECAVETKAKVHRSPTT